MLRTVFAVAAIVIGVTAVAAQSDPIEKRNALMSSLWRDGFSGLFRMTRGQAPFDQAKADASLEKMSEIVQQLPPLWPPDSKPPANPKTKYSSSTKVWDNKPDFDAKLTALAKSISNNRGKLTSLDAVKSAATEINQACDNCHETYQVKNQ